jgi:hypothetical protein
MARVPSRHSFATCAAWLACGFLVWSCSSEPGPGNSNGRGGNGGSTASAGAGGSATDGGTTNGQAGGDQTAGTAALGGTAGSGGTSGNGAGGLTEVGGSAHGGVGTGAAGGRDSAGAAGSAEGGAGGSDDSAPDFDGHCGTGWAAGSTAPLPKLSGTVTPKSDSSGNWSFSFGRYRLVVAGSRGARVIEYSVDGNNLIDATEGSTFWPSPQQAYTWPPPVAIDSGTYKAQADATSVTLTSSVGTLTGSGSTTFKLSVRKRFWVNANSGVLSIEYQLTNEGKDSASWAPWEVTRVAAGGYTFAPQGPGNRTITQDSFQKPLTMSLLPPPPAADVIAWLNYPGLMSSLTGDNYLTEFDGAEGWLAHANRFGTKQLPVLFVKSFVDAPDASLPTNQAEIQLWTSGTAKPKLIEVEQQGASQLLAAGESLTWTVHWSACELASSALLAAGNAELAALARAHAVKP